MQMILLPGSIEVEAVGDDRLGVLREGAGEHVGDHVVGVGRHEAVDGGRGRAPVDPPEGGPRPAREVHRHNVHLAT